MLRLVRRGVGPTPRVYTHAATVTAVLSFLRYNAESRPTAPKRGTEDPCRLVHLLVHELTAEGATEGSGESEDPLANVLLAVWDMLYADDASIVSRPTQGLTKIRPSLSRVASRTV